MLLLHNNNSNSGLQVKMYVIVHRFMVYRSGFTVQGSGFRVEGGSRTRRRPKRTGLCRGLRCGMRSKFMYMAPIRN
jgi:hypothetical protein